MGGQKETIIEKERSGPDFLISAGVTWAKSTQRQKEGQIVPLIATANGDAIKAGGFKLVGVKFVQTKVRKPSKP